MHHWSHCCFYYILTSSAIIYLAISQSKVQKSNSIKWNWTQSMDWVWLSSAIKPTQTLLKLCVSWFNRLCRIGFGSRTLLSGIQWIAFNISLCSASKFAWANIMLWGPENTQKTQVILKYNVTWTTKKLLWVFNTSFTKQFKISELKCSI